VPARKSHGQVSRASDSRPCDAEPRAGTGKIRAVQPYAVLGSPDSGCVPDTRRHISVAATRCPLSRVRTRRAYPPSLFRLNRLPVAEVAGALSRLDSGRRVGRVRLSSRCDHYGSTPALPCGRGMRILHIPGLPTLHLATVPTKDVTTAQRG
jgi:hypothetical protein